MLHVAETRVCAVSGGWIEGASRAIGPERRFSPARDWKNLRMTEPGTGALERGREAFERRSWGVAFDELCSSDAERLLCPEDLERLGEAARWSRHFDGMFDAFERSVAGYEMAGDRRSAARVAVKLTLEHHARRGDALAVGWLARAGRLLEGAPACRERGLVLMCMAQGMFFAGNDSAALQISQEMVTSAASYRIATSRPWGALCWATRTWLPARCVRAPL